MDKGRPLVSVLILNWNRVDETLRAIRSAINQSYPNIEVIVIDNCSNDLNTREKILSAFSGIKYVGLKKNYGCPGGRNRGIPYCNGEFIFFCDNDGILHKDAVQNAINNILLDEKIAIVTGFVKEFNHEIEIDTEFNISECGFRETHLFQGGITLHRKKIYNEIGFYPDDYIYGGEETYLSLKLIDYGYKIIKNNRVILWHKKSIYARNHNLELLRKWQNVLKNAYQLFPIEFFIPYFLYYLFIYPYYAYKYNILKIFIKSIPKLIKDLFSYDRLPIKRRTYIHFKKLSKVIF